MAYQPQGPVYNPPQQQIATVSSGNTPVNAHYNSLGSRRTGWIQLVCGCICVLLGIVAIFIKCYMSGGYFPIWSGLLVSKLIKYILYGFKLAMSVQSHGHYACVLVQLYICVYVCMLYAGLGLRAIYVC